ncbi:MAG TPA: DNA polymerase III subunit delta, partial [Ktedonobacterales bacterium]|nr:DNA polymerase III subunit delta [Ktedonobacterales bacterium]
MFIVLHGTDDFSSREALRKLLDDPRFTYNVERFEGASADIGVVRVACETMPFLSEGRLVVVDGLPKPRKERGGGSGAESANATPEASAAAPDAGATTDATPAKGKRGTKKPTVAALAKEFAGALAQIGTVLPETTTLAVIVEEELPKTHPLIAAAQAQGKIMAFAPPTGAALEKWIAQRAKAEGVAIAPNATSQLATFAVGQLRTLANEIAKLATYVGQGNTIDLHAVNTLVADSREARVFDLTNALAEGKRSVALQLLHELLDEGQQPLAILGMVTYQVRVMAQVKDLATRGARSDQIASQGGLSPYVV